MNVLIQLMGTLVNKKEDFLIDIQYIIEWA